MIFILFTLVLAGACLLSFAFGRATADRRVNLNHHQMMMMLMGLRTADDNLPIMPSGIRQRVDTLLTDYERLDLNE